MLIDPDIAMASLKADGVDREDFYLSAPLYVKASIQYLYGLEIFHKMDPRERVQEIAALVASRGSQQRLASIVFAMQKDRMITEARKAAYLQMALTCYLFSR